MTASPQRAPDKHDSWITRANCADVNTELFFPGRGEPAREARAVCAGCEVRNECLTYALDNSIKHGIWGGLSERERSRIRRVRTKNCGVCGTPFEISSNNQKYCSPACAEEGHRRAVQRAERRRKAS